MTDIDSYLHQNSGTVLGKKFTYGQRWIRHKEHQLDVMNKGTTTGGYAPISKKKGGCNSSSA
jgi:hypothetical protein